MPSASSDLKASHADRQRHARIEHDQWMKDHPDFSTQEMLENWRHIREHWGLTHDKTQRKAA